MEFRILGPIEVLRDGRVVPVEGRRQRALLAFLLLRANEVVASDVLLDALWSDAPPAAGRTALRVRVSQLRKVLGAGHGLATRPPGYVLAVAPEELDLTRFERLTEQAGRALAEGAAAEASRLARAALALWRGPPLGDVAYEPFAQPDVVRLEELRLTALERRIEAELALGRHEDLVAELEGLAAQHPLREGLRRQLMLALYRSGRQAEALDVYAETRATLVDTLGIEPGEPLRELQRAILRQDPSLAAPPAQPGPRPSAPRRSVLVLVRDEARAQILLALGRDLARGPRELVLARLAATAAELGTAHAWAEQARDELAAAGVRARLAAFTSSAPGEDAVRLSAQQDVDLLLTDVGPDELERLPAELVELLEGAACDVGLVTALAAPAAEGTARVLVPFGGAEHDWAAVELAAWLARATDGRLVLAGTVGDPDGGRRDASRLLASASLIVQQVAGVAAEPALVDAGAEGVLSAAAGARAVVVGLSDRWRREGVGAERLALARGVAAPTVLVRRGVRPGGLSPAESLTRFTWTIASAVPGGPATGT